jgi:hypothetical protein
MDQFDKKLIETLKSLRNDPDFGAALDFEGIHRRAMVRHGFAIDGAKTRYTFRDYIETYTWQLTHTLLKPMAATLAVFLFAVMGSVTMAGAGGGPPGCPPPRLYPVKLAIEKTQLALSVDADARAALRVEFASRRLEEMVELAANVSSSDRVQLAADRFKNEVASIQVELMASSDTAQFAKSLGRKVDIYSSTVASTSDDLPKEVLGEVEEILEETKEQVVEVIITAHESEQDPETAHELDDALAQEIETVFATYGVAASEAMATAEALRAEGLYRRAFQVLKDFTFELELQNE